MTRLADSPLDEPPAPHFGTLDTARVPKVIVRPFILKLLLVPVGLFGLSLFLPCMPVRGRKKADQTEAVSNARKIGLALSDFKDQFGQYPDSTTIGKVREKSHVDWNLGTKTSNDFFRQLLAVGSTQSEKIFYAKVAGARKPDDLVAGSSGLEKRECAFAYFMGAIKESGPLRPLAITPLIPGTDRFDPKPFDHKAVVLRLDNSVTSMNIDREGHVIVDGRNLMDPQHPIWEGHPPVTARPEL